MTITEYSVQVDLAVRAWGYIEAPTEEEARTIAQNLVERRATHLAERFWQDEGFETSFEEVAVLDVEESNG